MFNSDKGYGVEAFITAVALSWAIVVSLLLLKDYETNPCPINYDACTSYKSSKNKSPFGSHGETEAEKQESYRNEYRSEQDLIAQQEMSSATKWMMFTGILGLPMIFFASVFAWRAAHWASEAAKEAKRGADASLIAARTAIDNLNDQRKIIRSHLQIRDVEFSFLQGEEKIYVGSGVRNGGKCKFEIINVGNIIAYGGTVGFEIFIKASSQNHERRIKDTISFSSIATNQKKNESFDFEFSFDSTTVFEERVEDMTVRCIVSAAWNDAFGHQDWMNTFYGDFSGNPLSD